MRNLEFEIHPEYPPNSHTHIWEGGPNQGEDRVTLWIFVLADVFQTFLSRLKKIMFGEICYTCTGIECTKQSM
jgi:hypothetical protein